MKRIATIALFSSLVILSACFHRKNHSPMPSISDEAKAAQNKPVNCATAQQDIETLEGEKASVAKQALAGVRSVIPFAAASGLLMGDYEDRVSVATGDYNADIQAKIDQIKHTCGIPDTKENS